MRLVAVEMPVTVNVALDEPAGTVTVAGTLATVGSLLVSVTVTPPDGAEPVSEIVTVATCPAGT